MTVSARLLQVLSLLQARPSSTGQELADRLGVSARTVRSDIDKLRELGYPVHAVPGVAGGYRLAPGAKLPPLLLDDDEATAAAIGLNSAAGGAVAGIEEAAARALAKARTGPALPAASSDRPPPHLHRHPQARRPDRRPGGTDRHRRGLPGPAPSPLRLPHPRRRRPAPGGRAAPAGAPRSQVVPRRLGPRPRRLAHLPCRPDAATDPHCTPREPPEQDLSAYVAKGVDAALSRYRARVLVHKSATDLVQWLPPAVAVEAVDDHTCLVHVGADTPHMLAATILVIDADFEVDGPPELLDALRAIGDRCAAATTASFR
jgi:predicted DNA-binding transcriptional regulator YafY